MRGDVSSCRFVRTCCSSRSSTRARKDRKFATVNAEDQDLWEALRRLRKSLATEHNVPPYVIFHDATLKQMAADRPESPDALLNISGVGQAKLERYGDAFLEVVAAAGAGA